MQENDITFVEKTMEEYTELEIDDLVFWQDPNKDFMEKEYRVVNIHSFGEEFTSSTIVTIMDKKGLAYDVYACELSFA